MANTSSAGHDVITAIVAGMRDVTGYRSPWAQVEGITVYDTVEVLLSDEDEELLLVVGWPGQDPGGEAGDAVQTIATLGTGRHREENGVIRCLVVRQTGDHEPAAGVIPGMRADAFAVVDALDAYLRSTPSLDLVPAYRDLTAWLAAVTAVRPYASRGVVVEVEFTISYRARV